MGKAILATLTMVALVQGAAGPPALAQAPTPPEAPAPPAGTPGGPPPGGPPVPGDLPPDVPPPAPRAKGPALALAIEAARTAIASCKAKGYPVTVLVADSAGVPVAMLADDGSQGGAQYVSPAKVATTLRYKVASGVIAEKVKTDAALKAETKADPRIKGLAWRGALPILQGGELVGAIGVAGAPAGEKDEACAQAGLDAIAGKLK